MYYIGIDPGINSGVTIFKDNGKYIDSFSIPVIVKDKNKKEIDVVSMSNLLSKYKNKSKIIIEQVHSIQGQGIVSSFTFGRTTGMIYSIARLIDNDIQEISPQKWQNYLSKQYITTSNYEIKNKMYKEFFNHLCSLKSSKQSKINSAYLYYLIDKKLKINYKDNNIVDSYLIGWYCYLINK